MSIHHSNYNQHKINPCSTQTLSSILWFSTIMIWPLTTPCNQNSVPSPPPFWTAHGRISDSKSIHLSNMQPLTLMPKFYIIQAKCTYGFTHKPKYQWIQIPHSQWWFLLPFGKTRPQIKSNDSPQKLNAPVIVNRKIINIVMSSAQESETGPCFINGKYSAILHNALYRMSHIQCTTPIQFHNIVANRIITETVVQRRSKAVDMRL